MLAFPLRPLHGGSSTLPGRQVTSTLAGRLKSGSVVGEGYIMVISNVSPRNAPDRYALISICGFMADFFRLADDLGLSRTVPAIVGHCRCSPWKS